MLSPTSIIGKKRRHEQATNPRLISVNTKETNGIWHGGADDSLFNNTHIEMLLGNELHLSHLSGIVGNGIHPTVQNEIGVTDDQHLPLAQETVQTRISSCEIDGNDTLFADINLEDLVQEDQQNPDNDNHATKSLQQVLDVHQSTPEPDNLETITVSNSQQLFYDNVHFRTPPKMSPKSSSKSDILLANSTISIDNGHICGSQYQTREEIQLKKQTTRNQHNAYQQDLNNLSTLNWESQVFEDVITKKGDFYGLPKKVKDIIFEHKGITSLYEWQDECLHLPAIYQRTNLIYALPTSGGKTLVAEILMLREVICREKNVLFILPYVSIVQEKVSAMAPFAIALDFIVEEYTAGRGKCPPVARRKRRSIYIASIEKGSVLLDSLIEAHRANEIGLVVVDELHLIGERGRGGTLESLLTKIMFLNANIQIIGMSATIGNLSEISHFLRADVYTRGFRPVELKEYIKCGKDLLRIDLNGKSLEDTFIYERTVNFKYSEAVLRSDPDHLAGLVSECAPNHGCLIFCSTRKNCENVALLLCRILPKARFLEHRKNEKKDLIDLLDKICGVVSPVLARTIPYGVVYHHSGLTTEERKFLEYAYRFGVLSVICCTSTLAAGVNLPAKRVIIRAPYVGNQFVSLSKYKQMVGRAGRAGFGETGESILITSNRDNARVGEMLFSPMDRAISSLASHDYVGLQTLILSVIGLGLASTRNDLNNLMQSTLLQVQAEDLGLSVDSMIMDILRDMFRFKILTLNSDLNDMKINENDTFITSQDEEHRTTQKTNNSKRIIVGRNTKFQLTKIGRAAFKAGIDYNRASVVCNELHNALKHLILSNNTHLLYLIICFNSNANGDELFSADAGILFQQYEKADENTQLLFKLLGFTEAQAAKMIKTMSIQGPLELRLNRIYKVLILNDMLNIQPLPLVAKKFNVDRGILQNLCSQSISAANAIFRLCDEIDEFWCLRPLFERIGQKLDRCGTMELEPLLTLPSVKINRAKQLYSAGYKTIEDIAKVSPGELVQAVAHMPMRIAKEIVSAAKISVIKRLNDLEEETESLKICLKPHENSPKD